MDFPTSVSSFTSGSAITDTVTPALSSITSQTASLGSLSAIPGMSTVSSTISSLVSQATTTWQGILSSLHVTLPVMKAIHIAEAKLQMANGGTAPTQGSSTFSSYFGSIQSAQSQISALSSSITSNISTMASQASGIAGVTGSGPAALASLAAAIPPATIIQNGNPVTNPAYTTFMSTNSAAISNLGSSASSLNSLSSTASTNITSAFSSASSTMAGGVAKLKAMAFSSFCAQTHPAPIQTVLSQTINTAQVPTQNQLKVAANATSAWLQNQNATGGPDGGSAATPSADNISQTTAPSATTFTPSGCSPTQLAAIDAAVENWAGIYASDKTGAQALYQPVINWMNSVNYLQVKNNKDTDPTTYNTLKTQMEATTQFQSYFKACCISKFDNITYKSLQAIQSYMHNNGPWPGNSSGPWDTGKQALNIQNATTAATPGNDITSAMSEQARCDVH